MTAHTRKRKIEVPAVARKRTRIALIDSDEPPSRRRFGGLVNAEEAGMDVPIGRETSLAQPRTIIYFARPWGERLSRVPLITIMILVLHGVHGSTGMTLVRLIGCREDILVWDAYHAQVCYVCIWKSAD